MEGSLPNPARCGRNEETYNGLAAGAREPGAVNQVDTTPLQAGTR